MSNEPVPVSVVIPYYRGAATIQRAVRSLDAQSTPPGEIVIVDDGSPEPLPAVQSRIPVRVLRHETNRGIPSARNTGIGAATGAWLGFLDQDDEWAPGKLERQWAEAATASEPVALFGRLLHTGGGAHWHWPPDRAAAALEAGGAAALEACVRVGNAAPIVTMLVDRRVFERIGPLDETLRGGSDDFELLLRMVAELVPLKYVAPGGGFDHLAVHHFTGSNYSAYAPRFLEDDLALIEKLAERYPLIAGYRERLLARTHYTYGRHCDRTGETVQARGHYREAARLDPRLLRARLAGAWLRLPQQARDTLSAVRDRIGGRA